MLFHTPETEIGLLSGIIWIWELVKIKVQWNVPAASVLLLASSPVQVP